MLIETATTHQLIAVTGRHTGLAKFGDLMCAGMNSAVRRKLREAG